MENKSRIRISVLFMVVLYMRRSKEFMDIKYTPRRLNLFGAYSFLNYLRVW